MLDKNTAQDVLFEAISLGADFCDIFVERHKSKNIQVLSSKVHEIKSGIDFGIGVRLIYGTKVLYGYTNRIDKEELIRWRNKKFAQNYLVRKTGWIIWSNTCKKFGLFI